MYTNTLDTPKQKEQKETTAVLKALNQLLANYNIYQQNLQTFSWKLTSKSDTSLKDKLNLYFEDSQLKIDTIAKRILELGHQPKSRLSTYINLSEIKEVKGKFDEKEMLLNILESQKILIQYFQQTITAAQKTEDISTVDMVYRFMKTTEILVD